MLNQKDSSTLPDTLSSSLSYLLMGALGYVRILWCEMRGNEVEWMSESNYRLPLVVAVILVVNRHRVGHANCE